MRRGGIGKRGHRRGEDGGAGLARATGLVYASFEDENVAVLVGDIVAEGVDLFL